MTPMRVRVIFLSCQWCDLLFLSFSSHFHSGYPQIVNVLRDQARVSFEDEDNYAVVEHAALFTSRIVFGIPNVVLFLFIRTAMEGSLHRDKTIT